MIIKMYKCAHHNSRAACRTEGVSLFQNLDEYIKENSGQFSDLVLNNFWSIFFSYFVACFIAFSAFCVHNLVKFVKNVIEIVKRRRNRTEIDVFAVLFPLWLVFDMLSITLNSFRPIGRRLYRGVTAEVAEPGQ